MNFFKIIKNYFAKKNKPKLQPEESSNIKKDINIKGSDLDSFSSNPVGDKDKISQNAKECIKEPIKPNHNPAKKVKKKKPSKKKVSFQKQSKKIPRIDENEDLYELFTGLKNEDVQEYIPMEKDRDFHGLKSGHISKSAKPQKTIDLHHCTSKEAEQIIEREVFVARSRGIKSIEFITGKGLHSKNQESILKEVAQNKAADLKTKRKIRSFKWEKKQKRKSGAIIYYI